MEYVDVFPKKVANRCFGGGCWWVGRWTGPDMGDARERADGHNSPVPLGSFWPYRFWNILHHLFHGLTDSTVLFLPAKMPILIADPH